MDNHADCRLSEYMLDILRITGPLSHSQLEQFQYLSQRQESRQNIAEIRRIGREVFPQNFYENKTKSVWQSPRKYEFETYGDKVLKATKILEDLLPKYVNRHVKDEETQTSLVLSNDVYTQTEKCGGTGDVDVVDLTNLMTNTAKTVPGECIGNVEVFMNSCLEKLHTNYTEHLFQNNTEGNDNTWNSHREYPARNQEHISADFETHMTNVLNTTLSTLRKRMDSFVNYESNDKEEGRAHLKNDRIQQYIANQRVQFDKSFGNDALVYDIGNYELSETNLGTILHEIDNGGYIHEQYAEFVEEQTSLKSDTVSVPIPTEYYTRDNDHGKKMDSATLSIPSTLSYYASESSMPYNWARNCPSDLTTNSADDEYFREKIVVPKLDLSFLKDVEPIDLSDPDSDSSVWSNTPCSEKTFKEWLKSKGIDITNEQEGEDEFLEVPQGSKTEIVSELNKDEIRCNLDEAKIPVQIKIATKTTEEEEEEEEEIKWYNLDETKIPIEPKIAMETIEEEETIWHNLDETKIPIEPKIAMKTTEEEEMLWRETMKSMTTDVSSSEDEFQNTNVEQQNKDFNKIKNVSHGKHTNNPNHIKDPNTRQNRNIFYGKKTWIDAQSVAAKIQTDNFKSSSAPDVQIKITEKPGPKKSTSLNKVCKKNQPTSYQETQEVRGHGDVQLNRNIELIEENYPKVVNLDIGDLSPLEPKDFHQSIWKAAKWVESVNTYMLMNEMQDICDNGEQFSDVDENEQESGISSFSSPDIIAPKMIKCSSSHGQASTLQSIDSIANEICYEMEIPEQTPSKDKLQRTGHVVENTHLVGHVSEDKDSFSSSTENDIRKTNLQTPVTGNTNITSSDESSDGYRSSIESMQVYHNLSQESDRVYSISPVESERVHSISHVASEQGHSMFPVESKLGHSMSPVEPKQGHSMSPMESKLGHSMSPLESKQGHSMSPVDSKQGHLMSPVESKQGHSISPVENDGQDNEIADIVGTEQFAMNNRSESDESSEEYRTSKASMETNYRNSSLESLSSFSSASDNINKRGACNNNEQNSFNDKKVESCTAAEQYRQDVSTMNCQDNQDKQEIHNSFLELESNQTEEHESEIIPNCLNHIAKNIQRGLNSGADDSNLNVLDENCSMSIATIPPASPSYFLNMENKIDSDRSDSFGSYHEPDILTLGSWESITPREEAHSIRWPSVPPKYKTKKDEIMRENSTVLRAPEIQYTENKETADNGAKAQNDKNKGTINYCAETNMSDVCKKEQNVQLKENPSVRTDSLSKNSTHEQHDNLHPKKEVQIISENTEFNASMTNHLSEDTTENKTLSNTKETVIKASAIGSHQHATLQSEPTELQMDMKTSEERLKNCSSAENSATSVIDEQRPLTTEHQLVVCSDNMPIGSVGSFDSQKSDNSDIGQTDSPASEKQLIEVGKDSVNQEKIETKDSCDHEIGELNLLYYNRSSDFVEAALGDSSVESENSDDGSVDRDNDLVNDTQNGVDKMSDGTESTGSWDSNDSGEKITRRKGKNKKVNCQHIETGTANVNEDKYLQNGGTIIKPLNSGNADNDKTEIPNIDEEMSEKGDGTWDSSLSEKSNILQHEIDIDELSVKSTNSWDSCKEEDCESHEQDIAKEFENKIKMDTQPHEKQVIQERRVSFDMNVISTKYKDATNVDQVKTNEGRKDNKPYKSRTTEYSTELGYSDNDLRKSDENVNQTKQYETTSKQATPKRDTSSDDMSIESVGSWQKPEKCHVGIRGLQRRAKFDCNIVNDTSNSLESGNRQTDVNQIQDFNNTSQETAVLYHGAIVIKDRGNGDTSDDCSVIDMPESELAKWRGNKTTTKQTTSFSSYDAADPPNYYSVLPQPGKLDPITTAFKMENQPTRASKGVLKPVVVQSKAKQQSLPFTTNGRFVNSPTAVLDVTNASRERAKRGTLAPLAPVQTKGRQKDVNPQKKKHSSKAKSGKIVKEKVMKTRAPEKVEVYGDSSTETFSMPSFELAEDFKVNETGNHRKQACNLSDDFIANSSDSSDDRYERNSRGFRQSNIPMDDDFVVESYESSDDSFRGDTNANCKTDTNNHGDSPSASDAATNTSRSRIHQSPVRAVDTSKSPVSCCMPDKQKKVTFAQFADGKPPLRQVSSAYKWSRSSYSDQPFNQPNTSSVLKDNVSPFTGSSQRLTSSAYRPGFDALSSSCTRKDHYGIEGTYGNAKNALMIEKRSLGELRIIDGPVCERIEIVNTCNVFSGPTRSSSTNHESTWEPLRMVSGSICPIFEHVKEPFFDTAANTRNTWHGL